jgi:hypothetical protein
MHIHEDWRNLINLQTELRGSMHKTQTWLRSLYCIYRTVCDLLAVQASLRSLYCILSTVCDLLADQASLRSLYCVLTTICDLLAGQASLRSCCFSYSTEKNMKKSTRVRNSLFYGIGRFILNKHDASLLRISLISMSKLVTEGTLCSLSSLVRRPGSISECRVGTYCASPRQTEGHLFGDHPISESVSVAPSSVTEA